VCERLLEEGLFVKDTQRTTLRLAPTLVVTEAELDLTLECIATILAASSGAAGLPGHGTGPPGMRSVITSSDRSTVATSPSCSKASSSPSPEHVPSTITRLGW
jgi:hypothetical protein